MGRYPALKYCKCSTEITEGLSKLMAVKLRTVDCAGLKPNVGRKKSKKLKSRERSSGGQNQNSFWNPFIGVIEG